MKKSDDKKKIILIVKDGYVVENSKGEGEFVPFSSDLSNLKVGDYLPVLTLDKNK